MKDIELLAQTLKNGDFPLLQSKTFSIGLSDLDQTALQQGYCVITEETNQTLFNSIKEFCLSCKNNEIANINVRASVGYIVNTIPEIYFGAGYFEYQEPQSTHVYGGDEVNHCQINWTWLVYNGSTESHGKLGIGYREVDNGSDIDEYCYLWADGNVFDPTTSQMLIASIGTTPAVFTVYYYASNIEPQFVVDPVLENNDWATIRQVCESGKASNYWSVGDTKTDVGTDGNTRTFRIVDMQGLYGKHVVFEQVECDYADYQSGGTYGWMMSTSGNNYSTSSMRTDYLSQIASRYSNELQNSLTNTTYEVAENGASTSVLELTDKLFLPASKEVSTSASFSTQQEAAALTTFAYYQVTSSTILKKCKLGTNEATSYWLRSPYGSSGGYAFTQWSSSYEQASIVFAVGNSPMPIAPCFSF